MKRLTYLVAVLLLASFNLQAQWGPILGASRASGLKTVSDDFSAYADNALLESQANWAAATGASSIKITVSAGVHRYIGNASSTNSLVYYTGTWAANQSSTAKVSFTNTVNYVGVAVRANNTGGGNGYAIVYNGSGTIYLNVLNSGSWNAWTSGGSISQSLSVGDTLTLSVSGTGASTRLTISVNGTPVLSNQDPGGTYVSSGAPGVATYTTGSTVEEGMTNWVGAEI